MSTTLPLFWHLSSGDPKERLNASVKLIGALEQFQAQFTPKEPSPEPSEEDEDEDEHGASKADGLDALNAQDVAYSVRRLVRGLASPRESSRLGFAVALTELLSRLDTVTCSQIITLILDSSQGQGSMSGQEERDVLFSRLFGFSSIIQSGLLFRTQPLRSSSTPASDLQCYSSLLSELLALGEKKSWLRESAWWALELAVDALYASDVSWRQDAVQATIQCIFGDEKIHWSPEKVALTLKLQTLSPEVKWKKLLAPTFKNPDILSTANLSTLARILKESYQEDEQEGKSANPSSGSWNPQIHYVWDVLLDRLLPDKSDSKPQGTIQEFFRIVVDESLFAVTSSPERKYWGFQIFQKALGRASADSIPMLFTKNFMRCWINHLSKNDRYLHKIARQAAVDLQSAVQNDSTIGLSVVLQLTGPHGSHNFDKLTKTKTVESILASMQADGIQSYIEHLLEQVNESSHDQQDAKTLAARRSWIIEQLPALVHNPSIPKSDDWIQTVLEWLLVNGLFVVTKASQKSSYRPLRTPPTPPLPDALRERCRSRLLTCLADLTSRTTTSKADDNKTIKLSAAASDGEYWVSKVIDTIGRLEKDTKHVSLLHDADEVDISLRQHARETIISLREMQKSAARGAELLLGAALLHCYCTVNSDVNEDTDSLQACIDAARRMFPTEPKEKTKKKARPSATEASADDGPIPPPIDVLVDTIIGFLEKSTAYMRAVSNQVFQMLSGEVQESTMDLILTQLERRDPTVEHDVSDNEDMEPIDDESDVSGADHVEDHESKFAEDGGEEEESEDNGEDEDDEETVELRRKLEGALKANGIEGAAESGDESDELMDDEQMMAIDEHLAQIFKARRTDEKKKKDSGAQREATHFKNRVLDLVDVFLRTQPSSPFVLRCIMPLLDLITGTGSDEKQLSDKATGVLRSRIGKNKDVPSRVGTDVLEDTLRAVHVRAKKARSTDILTTLSQCSLFLSRALLHSDGRDVVVEVYRESLVDFITRKGSSLNGAFLQDFVGRHPAEAWDLRTDIISVTSKAANAYRQCQGYQILQALFSRLPAVKELEIDFVDFIPALRQATMAAVTEACEESTLTAAQLKDVFKLVLSAVRRTKRTCSPTELSSLWDPASWDTLCDKLIASERFQASTGLHASCRQVVQLTSTADGQEPKRSKVQKPVVDSPVIKTKRKAEKGARSGEASDKAKRKKAKRA